MPGMRTRSAARGFPKGWAARGRPRDNLQIMQARAARRAPREVASDSREEGCVMRITIYFGLGALSDRVLNLLLRGAGEGERPKSELVREVSLTPPGGFVRTH